MKTAESKTLDEFWDDNSEMIDDDIDSLQVVAGTIMMNRKQFDKAMKVLDNNILQNVSFVQTKGVGLQQSNKYCDCGKRYQSTARVICDGNCK